MIGPGKTPGPHDRPGVIATMLTTTTTRIATWLVALGWLSAGKDVPAEVKEVPLGREWRVTCAKETKPLRVVARTEAEFAALWLKAHGKSKPLPPTPRVDFARDMVLGVFAGESRSGDHRITITRVMQGEKE